MNCTAGFHCAQCDETVLCGRDPNHKGFHRDGTDLSARHTWDEYGDVEHI
jgi:hypothetical protein